MPFRSLLANTDVLITAGCVNGALSGCLPNNNDPLELSLGNRPLLWHVLHPLVDSGARRFFLCVAQDCVSAAKALVDAFVAHHRLTGGPVVFSLVVVDELDIRERPVAQIVEYARQHRSSDSVSDLFVVNFDTILSAPIVTKFFQGFETNFASVSVLYLEHAAKAVDTDYICVDDAVQQAQQASPAGACGQCFCEHRRLHLSEVMPCDPEHALRSSMLVRRPQVVFSKRFRQLPVYLLRPWVAPMLVMHYDSVHASAAGPASAGSNNSSIAGAASQGAAAAATATSSNNNSNNNNNNTNTSAGNNGAVPLQAKMREDLIPLLLSAQFTSFVASQHSPAGRLGFSAVHPAQRLRQDLGLPAGFSIPVHWCLGGGEEAPGGATLASSSPPHHLGDDAAVTLDALNAMTLNLASARDHLRVFATLCRRSPDTGAAFPEVRCIDTAAAYVEAVALLRDGLALPPPPPQSSLQSFAVPDMRACTLALLAQGGATEAPAAYQRCALLTVPPLNCRVERCIVGAAVKFGEKCAVFDSVIMDGADIGAGATIRRSVIGPGHTVAPKATIVDAVVTWAGSEELGGNTNSKR